MLAAVALAAVLAAPPVHAHESHGARTRHGAHKVQQPWGLAGEAKDIKRTVEIAMSDDMRFSPSRIEVKQGETVRFVLRNRGKVPHEMVIGTASSLEDHAAMMRKSPGMEHEEPHMAHVAPGRTGELVWKFNRAGDFDFACLVPGHFQAGMVGTIRVAGSAPR
jgi:uncharacterized cupredoxin-like copper-binding protein